MARGSRGHGTAAYSGKVYVFGGVKTLLTPLPPPYLDGGQSISNEVDAYDPVSNEWASRKPMPVHSHSVHAHTIGDKIYVIAAYGRSGFHNGTYRYDPVADEWSTLAARPTYRYEFASAVVGGKIYVIGGVGTIDDGLGQGDWTTKSHVEVYDPATDRWSSAAPLPMPLGSTHGCALADNIYVFGGRTVLGPGSEAFVLTYDPAANSWSAKSPMKNPREGLACVVIGDAAYLLGGRSNGDSWELVERYDPLLETWTSVTRLPTGRYWFGAAVLGDEILTFGGQREEKNALVDVVEIYDTASDSP